MKKRFTLLFIISFTAACIFAQTDPALDAVKKISEENIIDDGIPVKFEFKYQEGDHYKIHSQVEEAVYFNHRPDHTATIINRVTAKVDNVTPDGKAVHTGTFMTSENSVGAFTGGIFTYGEEYESVFTRDKSGVYTIDDKYFMPVVRDVPVFPDRELKPGDKWEHQGHEVHDLRQNLNIQKPFKVPFTAYYEYIGKTENSGLYVFKIKYTIEMETPEPPDNLMEFSDYPVGMSGFSNQIVYWDMEKGAISQYTENFRIVMNTMYGNTFEFRGTAMAVVSDFVRINTQENLEQMQELVKDLDNVTVKQSDNGLTLSLEDIKFKADSSELLESEKEKLRYIGQILMQWPENDILITGHTALAGTARVRQILSQQRAESVAAYLIELGVRSPGHIFTKGLGATQPVASNATESGKAKNRRVEITIMDK